MSKPDCTDLINAIADIVNNHDGAASDCAQFVLDAFVESSCEDDLAEFVSWFGENADGDLEVA